MKNLLAFVAFLLLVFVGLGWYFEWYKVQTGPTQSGHQSFNIDINTKKIGQDVKEGSQKLHEALDKRRTEQAEKKEPAPKDDPLTELKEELQHPPRIVITSEEGDPMQ